MQTLLFFLSVFLLQVTSAQATIFTVNSLDDYGDINIGDGICHAGGPSNKCTLRAAIEESNFTVAADIIRFSISGTITRQVFESLVILEDLTIQALEGTTYDGGGYDTAEEFSQLFRIRNDAVVTIDNLDMTGANFTGLQPPSPIESFQAPALSITGIETAVKLKNLQIYNNRAYQGLAVLLPGNIHNSSNGILSIENCDLWGNEDNGGAVGITSTRGGLEIKNSRIFNNTSRAVYARRSGPNPLSVANVMIEDSEIYGNVTDGTEGAVFVDGHLDLIDSIVRDNIHNGTPRRGAGIWVRNTDITRSEIRANISTGPDARGAGIYLFSGNSTITDSKIQDNICHDACLGAGIYVGKSPTATIVRSVISGNTVETSSSSIQNTGSKGGGIYIGALDGLSSGVINMTNSTVSGNSAEEGAGIYAEVTDRSTIYNSTIADNLGEGIRTTEGDGGTEELRIRSSILANNTVDLVTTLAGQFNSIGFNVFGEVDPSVMIVNSNDQVGTSADPITTIVNPLNAEGVHTLQIGSAALDRGDCTGSVAIVDDQLGQARPIDGDGDGNADCDAGAWESQSVLQFSRIADLKVFLSGPYSGGSMSSNLLGGGHLSQGQPYGGSEYSGTTLEYTGNEALNTLAQDISDWVLVELRETPSPSTIVGQQAALLMADGSVRAVDGVSPIQFDGIGSLSIEQYYVVVRHRNHLPVISSNSINFINNLATSYDFTDSMSKAAGNNPMQDLGRGNFGLWSGNGNLDAVISAFDFLNSWLPNNGGPAGYHLADFDLSGDVSAFDFLNAWLPANGQSSQVMD